MASSPACRCTFREPPATHKGDPAASEVPTGLPKRQKMGVATHPALDAPLELGVALPQLVGHKLVLVSLALALLQVPSEDEQGFPLALQAAAQHPHLGGESKGSLPCTHAAVLPCANFETSQKHKFNIFARDTEI